MLELRQEEEGHDPAHTSGTAPDEAALSGNVPARGVEELRGEVDHGDLGDVVRGATNGSAEGTEADGRGLGDDGVGDGAERTREDEGDQYSKDGLGVVGGAVLGDRGADTQEHEEGDVDGGAPEVDCAAAEPGGQGPRQSVCDELEAGVDEVEVEGHVVGHAGLLEEEGGLVGDQVTGEVLRGVHQAGDGGTSEIDTLEEVEECGGAADVGLDLNGTLDHCELALGLAGGAVGGAETLDGAEGFLLAAAADEPPRGLRSEPENHHERELRIWSVYSHAKYTESE